ncbi:MAG: cyclase family protein [Bryobacteraceae bacterium]
MSNWIDISVPVRNGMVHWPGDPPFHIERAHDQEKGDAATVSQMTLGVHTGTHMDAPLHFIRNGRTIDEMPLDATVGRARVVQIDDPKSIKREELLAQAISAGERILFKTANSAKAWSSDKFEEDFVFIAQDAARYLAERGVLCVGVDYLSVGGFHEDGPETHHALLEAGVWIIEGLDLKAIEPGEYDMACLPLKLIGAEGAPARAILRRVL